MAPRGQKDELPIKQQEPVKDATKQEVKDTEAPPPGLDDSMVFSDRKNLDDYIIGK